MLSVCRARDAAPSSPIAVILDPNDVCNPFAADYPFDGVTFWDNGRKGDYSHGGLRVDIEGRGDIREGMDAHNRSRGLASMGSPKKEEL
ncbi:hypothetical protein D9619_011462 [Psilocybe cf. subviscida]|uniref:Uncharacterized protein n=1 Tax=Psilocybe cf. subviscida TaxID=2480587 RepID=A0A8H5BSU4_9AGAR|nr:hypothetical protein D9619_011462 [Psilocybe cf. subviscida]